MRKQMNILRTRDGYPTQRHHPDGGALQNYANTLPEPDRSLFLSDLRKWAGYLGLRIR